MACDGGKANEQQAGEKGAAGGQQSRVDLPRFPRAPSDAENPRVRGSQNMTWSEFVQWAIVDADAKWQSDFGAASLVYTPVNYTIFWGHPVNSPECGLVKPSDGPIYCGLSDQRVYYPLEEEISNFGDFAVAFATAHEVGHHVQDELDILKQEDAGVYTSRQVELGADCLAGVWAYSVYSRNLLQKGDIEEAVRLEFTIGDLPGTSPTAPGAHGSSTERVEAFLAGYNNGNAGPCLAYTPAQEQTTG